MNTYYIAGYPVTDELYHHGVQGQKWGIRRYQNEDGTLTAEGRERYGKYELGKYAKNNNNLLRRIMTGDTPLGIKRYYDKKEVRLEKKIQKKLEKGKQVSESLLRKYNTIKLNNIERDVYNSYLGSGKIFMQDLLLGASAEYYRENRASGYGRLKSLSNANALVENDIKERTAHRERRNKFANETNKKNKT